MKNEFNYVPLKFNMKINVFDVFIFFFESIIEYEKYFFLSYFLFLN